MFALLPTPHPPIDPANLQTLSPTQYAYALPASLAFTHLVVFLLPGNALPPATAAGIYIKFPPSPGQADPPFRLLGALGEGKASAIFRVDARGSGAGTVGRTAAANDVEEIDMDADEASATAAAGGTGPSAGGPEGEIVIGIGIEPVATLGPQLAALAQAKGMAPGGLGSQATLGPDGGGTMTLYRPAGAAGSAVPTKVLAKRIIQNAFNFLASFSGNAGSGGEEVVPLKSFENWWQKFERRVDADPGFLEREGD